MPTSALKKTILLLRGDAGIAPYNIKDDISREKEYETSNHPCACHHRQLRPRL